MGDSYQVALVNAQSTFQTVLTNKQVADSTAGDIASTLLDVQISYSTDVVDADYALVEDAATAGELNGWTTSDSNNYSLANSVYQTDSTICQTGQNNGTTAVQQLQSAVSQDGTNISNAISFSNIFVAIGDYAANFLKQAYTAS